MADLATRFDTGPGQVYLDGRYGRAGGAGLMPGAVITVFKDPATGFWPASYNSTTGAPVYTAGSASAGVRPTSRADVMVIWKGPDPSPAVVSSGTGGMLTGSDERHITP